MIVFSGLVFLLTVFLSQWGQPWASVSLKTLALSVVEDELTLAVDSGVFNEPIPALILYVFGRLHGSEENFYFRSAES